MPSSGGIRRKNKEARRHRRRTVVYPQLFKGFDLQEVDDVMTAVYARLAAKERHFLEEHLQKLYFTAKVAEQMDRLGAYQDSEDMFHFPTYALDSNTLKAFVVTIIEKHGTDEEREALAKQVADNEKMHEPDAPEEVD